MIRSLHPEVEQALSKMRLEIDRIDFDIIQLFNDRLTVSEDIGLLKLKHNMAIVQTNRFEQLVEKLLKQSNALNISEDFMRAYLNAMHIESIRRQKAIQNVVKEV